MKIFKYLAIVVMTLLVSFFYFPVVIRAIPGANSKMILAVVGLAVCAWKLLKKPDFLSRDILLLMLFAGLVSLASLFSMVYNVTSDDAYFTYLVSMIVWLSAAFTCCALIRALHGYLDVRLAGKYMLAVCVFQCISTLVIDQYPQVDVFLDRYFDLGMKLSRELKRLHGFGSGLDTAGIRYSLCLIITSALLIDRETKMNTLTIYFYLLCYLFVAIVGCMVSRTTYVGIGLSLMYAFIVPLKTNFKGYGRIFGPFFLFLIIAFIACTFLYRTDPTFRHWIRFAFEGFFNLFETGEYSVASTDKLKSMYVFPDNFKTWVVGDGYFSNPYWSDPNFIWQGEATRGYYKDTDVGYLRFIFYFGLIGLTAFSAFILEACRSCIRVLPDYRAMFIFLCLAGFIVWLKVATDVFPIFAYYYCVGHMYEPSPQELSSEEDSQEDITF